MNKDQMDLQTSWDIPTEVTGRKRKRTEISLSVKLDIIRKFQNTSQVQIAKDLGIAQSTVSKILKHRHELVEEAIDTEKCNPDRKRKRLGKAVDIEERLYKWFVNARSRKSAFSNSIIREKATYLADKFENFEFKATAGWLCRWKRRYGVNLVNCRELSKSASGVEMDDVASVYSNASSDFSERGNLIMDVVDVKDDTVNNTENSEITDVTNCDNKETKDDQVNKRESKTKNYQVNKTASKTNDYAIEVNKNCNISPSKSVKNDDNHDDTNTESDDVIDYDEVLEQGDTNVCSVEPRIILQSLLTIYNFLRSHKSDMTNFDNLEEQINDMLSPSLRRMYTK